MKRSLKARSAAASTVGGGVSGIIGKIVLRSDGDGDDIGGNDENKPDEDKRI